MICPNCGKEGQEICQNCDLKLTQKVSNLSKGLRLLVGLLLGIPFGFGGAIVGILFGYLSFFLPAGWLFLFGILLLFSTFGIYTAPILILGIIFLFARKDGRKRLATLTLGKSALVVLFSVLGFGMMNIGLGIFLAIYALFLLVLFERRFGAFAKSLRKSPLIRQGLIGFVTVLIAFSVILFFFSMPRFTNVLTQNNPVGFIIGFSLIVGFGLSIFKQAFGLFFGQKSKLLSGIILFLYFGFILFLSVQGLKVYIDIIPETALTAKTGPIKVALERFVDITALIFIMMLALIFDAVWLYLKRSEVRANLTFKIAFFFSALFITILFGNGLKTIIQTVQTVGVEHIRLAILQVLPMTVGSIAVGVAIAWFVARLISRPVKSLIKGMAEVEKGDLDFRVKSETSDEIGDLTNSFNKMAAGLKEKELIKETFGKYVAKQVAEKIIKDIDKVKLEGERRKVTVMFTDLRGFTTMSEKMRPEEVVETLNEYFGHMVDIVFKYEGVLDKFIGDAMMIVFGAPIAHPDDEIRAVRAAMEMREELKKLNQKRRKAGKPEIHMGIGINTGEVVAGNIGSEKRMEYTVIGDDVNLAQRLESVARPGQILISKTVWEKVKGQIKTKKLRPAQLKGKAKPVEIFEI